MYETKFSNGDTLIVRNSETVARFYGDCNRMYGEVEARICADALNKTETKILDKLNEINGGGL